MPTIPIIKHARRASAYARLDAGANKPAGVAYAYLIAAIALLGLLSVVAFSVILHLNAPANSLRLQTQNTYLLQQAAAALTRESKDTDNDGIPEPPASVSGATAPSGGGNIPSTSKSPRTDAYGSPLGYCAWDNGSINSSTGRITGDNPANQKSILFAVVSAGPDRTFQSTCAGLATGVTAGDDSARWVVVAAASQAAGGNVWFGDPVADTATLNALGTNTITPGEIRLVKANNYLYQWNGTAWVNLSLAPTPADGARNFLINGNFDIWQRGTSFNVGTTNIYTADRWGGDISGTNATYSQVTVNPGDTNAPQGASDALQLTPSSGTTYWELYQPIENLRQFSGQTLTISFYARNTLYNASTNYTDFVVTLVSAFGSGGSSWVYTTDGKTYTPTATWAKYTVTLTVPDMTGKTFGTAGTDFLELVISENNNTGTPNLQFAQVQLEAGSTANSFEYRAIGKELFLCQRYYEIFDSGSTLYTTPYIPSGSVYRQPWLFRVTKRTTPTVTLTDAGSTGVGTPSVYSVAPTGFTEARTGSNTGQTTVMTNWTADSEF